MRRPPRIRRAESLRSGRFSPATAARDAARPPRPRRPATAAIPAAAGLLPGRRRAAAAARLPAPDAGPAPQLLGQMILSYISLGIAVSQARTSTRYCLPAALKL